MDLSLEEIGILCNAKIAKSKLRLIHETALFIGKDQFAIMSSVDRLMTLKLLEVDRNNFYQITNEGLEKLKTEYFSLQMLMLKFHQAIELC